MYEDRRVGRWPGWGCFSLAAIIVAAVCVWVILYQVPIGMERAAGIGASIVLFFFAGPLVVALGLVFGLLWAPFAALITARMANNRGLERRKYAIVGATYSVLFFWPWVYLIARMRNRRIWGWVIRCVYVILYGLIWPVTWLASAINLIFLSAYVSSVLSWILSPLLLLSVVMWFISKRNLTKWQRGYAKMRNGSPVDVLPDRVYILPFAYAFASVLFFTILWLGQLWVN